MKTKKEYKVHFKVDPVTDYGVLTIPKGTYLTHQTANGEDKNYHFVADFRWVEKNEDGSVSRFLLHDLLHHGIDVPKEYVEDELNNQTTKKA